MGQRDDLKRSWQLRSGVCRQVSSKVQYMSVCVCAQVCTRSYTCVSIAEV